MKLGKSLIIKGKFYAFKNVPMYNKVKAIWAKNVVYKKMFVWNRNTGFNCDAARNKVALECSFQTSDNSAGENSDIRFSYLSKYPS